MVYTWYRYRYRYHTYTDQCYTPGIGIGIIPILTQYRYRYRYGCLSSIGIRICMNHQPGIGMNVHSGISIGMVVLVVCYVWFP